jgi:hypothetical protein
MNAPAWAGDFSSATIDGDLGVLVLLAFWSASSFSSAAFFIVSSLWNWVRMVSRR